MGRKASAITFSQEAKSYFEMQTRSRTIQVQTVCKARILLLRFEGVMIDDIVEKVGINRCSAMLCLKI